jgi:hypothetical protein
MDIRGKSKFSVAGRLVSLAFFAFGLIFLKWSAAIALLGFWMEEVIALLFLLLRAVLASIKERAASGAAAGAEDAGSSKAALLILLFFPAIHLIFIAVFMFILRNQDPAADGISSFFIAVLRGRVYGYHLRALVPAFEIALAIVFWSVIELIRDMRKGGKGISMAEVSLRARSALVLPHVTIIAGGFFLTMTKGANWLAWALILVKCLFELLLLPGMAKAAAMEAAKASAEASAGTAGSASEKPVVPDVKLGE